MHSGTFYHSRKFDNSVVRVRAQVMMRDDSTGGWVPMGGGGLSNVSVRKRKISHEDDQPCKHEYLIHGKRHSDQSVVLSCTIKRDFEYNKVMPTFHHWKTGNKKFGLTFQTAADARAFDKGVRLAIEDLLDAKSLACPHKHYRERQMKGMPESSPLHQYNCDVGDDDVFMQLHLPLEKGRPSSNGGPHSTDSSAGSGGESGSGGGGLPPPPKPASSPHLYLPPPPRLAGQHPFIPRPTTTGGSSFNTTSTDTFIQHHQDQKKHLLLLQQPAAPPPPGLLQNNNKDSSYVKFPYRELSQTEYSLKAELRRKDSLTSLKKQQHQQLLQQTSALITSHECNEVGWGGDEDTLKKGSNSLFNSRSKKKKKKKSSLSFGSSPSGSSSSSSSISGLSSSSSSSKKKKKLLLLGEAGGSSSSPLPTAGPPGSRLTCDRCRTSFSCDSNHLGSCPEASDCVKKTIEGLSCLQCAKCLLYHCMSDSEGDYLHPCDCSNVDGHWARRWISLTLLSVLVPCLCCYIPLMGCYKLARKCRICGGRHTAAHASAPTAAAYSSS